MVTRILKYELDTPTSSATDEEVDSKSPSSGKTWDVQGIFSNDESSNEISLVVNERKLVDNFQSDVLANEDNVLPANIVVEEGDTLQVLNSDDGTQNQVLVGIVVDER